MKRKIMTIDIFGDLKKKVVFIKGMRKTYGLEI